MWSQGYAAPFNALLRRYADTIAASFAGHTHMDDFRLLGDGDGYYGFTLITPALSPIFGQNPAFRAVVYDPTGTVLDHTTYYLANLEAAATAGGLPPSWQAEYTFTQASHLPRVDTESLARLYAMTAGIPEYRDRWHVLYAVSSPAYWPADLADGERAGRAALAYHCAIANVSLSGYGQCYCGDGR